MKKICFEKNNHNCCFVDIIDDKVIIVTKGSLNPFDYLDQLSNSIQTLAKKESTKEVEVYVDFLSCVGDRVNRFGKTLFNNETKSLDVFSFVNIASDAIPSKIKKHLVSFYKKHTNSVINNSILTEHEIIKIKKTAI